MELITKTISDSLPPALKAYRPAKLDVKHFIDNLKKYLAHIDSKESEENLKTHLMDFLKPSYAPEHTVEQYGDIDFVIRKFLINLCLIVNPRECFFLLFLTNY